MRTHSYPRLSSTKRLELINEALKLYQALHDHAISCSECDDEEGVCVLAQIMYVEVQETSARLKRAGIDTGCTP